jgi:hypothetical protein
VSDILSTIASLAGPDAFFKVFRRPAGQMVHGKYVPSTADVEMEMLASIQPATGMQRVVGGKDMWSDEQGERVTDVRVVYTEFELRARTSTNDPDRVEFEGKTYTVFRQEEILMDGIVYYRALMTCELLGAA